MTTEQTGTCTNKTDLDGLLLIEYKTGRSVSIMGVPELSQDYHLAQQLKIGDKFVIQWVEEFLQSTEKIEIVPGIYKLPYIKQILTR